MMIRCPRHGASSGIAVCSHILKWVSARQQVPEFRMLIYEYLGEAADGCAFCGECGDEHGIPPRLVMPLPDVYPTYFPTSLGVCGRCFGEATATAIDWTVRANA